MKDVIRLMLDGVKVVLPLLIAIIIVYQAACITMSFIGISSMGNIIISILILFLCYLIGVLKNM